jgi:hypothetical protein
VVWDADDALAGLLRCGRLAAFAANTDLLAGSYSSAVNWWQQALGELAPDATKQRAVVLLDLASAHAPADIEYAATLTLQACKLLQADFYCAVRADCGCPPLWRVLGMRPRWRNRVHALPVNL